MELCLLTTVKEGKYCVCESVCVEKQRRATTDKTHRDSENVKICLNRGWKITVYILVGFYVLLSLSALVSFYTPIQLSYSKNVGGKNNLMFKHCV